MAMTNCRLCNDGMCNGNHVYELRRRTPGETQDYWTMEYAKWLNEKKQLELQYDELKKENDGLIRAGVNLATEKRELERQVKMLASGVDGLMTRATEAEAKLNESNRLNGEYKAALEKVRELSTEWNDANGYVINSTAKEALGYTLFPKPPEKPVEQKVKELVADLGRRASEEKSGGICGWVCTTIGCKEHRTERPKDTSPTERPCCVEAYARGYEVGKNHGIADKPKGPCTCVPFGDVHQTDCAVKRVEPVPNEVRCMCESHCKIARRQERERCAQLVNEWAKAYPASMFGNPEQGKHGPTVDSCSAKALRLTLPQIAEEIRGHELDE